MPEAWATCEAPGCNSNCGSSERYCAVHKDAFNTGEPMEIAWQLLKAGPPAEAFLPHDIDDEGNVIEENEPPKKDPLRSHLPLQHPARSRHRRQAARTGGIEGLEGTMPPEFGSDIDEQNKIADDFHDAEQKWRDAKARNHGRFLEGAEWDKLHDETKDAMDPVYEGGASGDYGRLPGKKDKRPELEPFERDEALAGEGAEMPDPHELEPEMRGDSLKVLRRNTRLGRGETPFLNMFSGVDLNRPEVPHGYEEEEEEPEPDRDWSPKDMGPYIQRLREMGLMDDDKPPTTAQTQGQAGGAMSREALELLGREHAMKRG